VGEVVEFGDADVAELIASTRELKSRRAQQEWVEFGQGVVPGRCRRAAESGCPVA
jgi:hypothetical protein